tara:strand:+ start:210 stop:707 length:498 start_codon:yes stop_codon:yes gene_type:complete
MHGPIMPRPARGGQFLDMEGGLRQAVMPDAVLTSVGKRGSLQTMKVWCQSVLAVCIMLALANPLCACESQKPVAAPESTGCCSAQTDEESAPKPSSAPSPCDCESAVHEGLLAAKEDSFKPAVLAATVPLLSISVVANRHSKHVADGRADFHGPPLRHLYSIYRL